MTLSTNIRVSVAAKQSSTLDLGSSDANISKNITVNLGSGTAAGQADRMYSKTNTLTASANVDLDLAGGVTDANGATITFAKVKTLLVKAADGNTNNVIVGGAPSNGWVGPFGAATHTVTVRPGETKLLACCGEGDLNGYAVTAGTGDLLRIANSGAGTSVSYDIVIVGTSA